MTDKINELLEEIKRDRDKITKLKTYLIVAIIGIVLWCAAIFIIGYFSHWMVSVGIVIYEFAMKLADQVAKWRKENV
jgi:hypothetical protein